MEISQVYLRELLHYDPDTGLWIWIAVRRGVTRGARAGRIHDGREYIRIDGRDYLSYRLAWLYMTGRWPENDIDHINCDKSDNRFSNLREATRSQNHANKPSFRKNGLKGTHLRGNKWTARIKVKQKMIHLGYFEKCDEAHAAYCRAATFYFGEYARP